MKCSATRKNAPITINSVRTCSTVPQGAELRADIPIPEISETRTICSAIFSDRPERRGWIHRFLRISSADVPPGEGGAPPVDRPAQISSMNSKEFRFSKPNPCAACGGTGADPSAGKTACPQCGGTGRVQGIFGMAQACPQCGGSGQIVQAPCRACGGQGRVQAVRDLKVHIPAGVDNGSKLRIPKEGEAGVQGGPPGDLYVIIKLRPHPVFKRDGLNLICERPIPFATAVGGGIIDVPTMTGKVRMKVPEGTQSGAVLRIKGRGFPATKGGGKGDQLVKIQVETPVALTKQQRDLLNYFTESLTSSNYPVQSRFEESAKRYMS